MSGNEIITNFQTGLWSADVDIGEYVHGGIRRSFEFEDPTFQRSKEVYISTSTMETEDEAWEYFPDEPVPGCRFIIDLMVYELYNNDADEEARESDCLRMFVASNGFLISEIEGTYDVDISNATDEMRNETIHKHAVACLSDYDKSRPAFYVLPEYDEDIRSEHGLTNQELAGAYQHSLDFNRDVWVRNDNDI